MTLAGIIELFSRAGVHITPAVAREIVDWVVEQERAELYSRSPAWSPTHAVKCADDRAQLHQRG
jgi:hypothetical protein